MAKNQKEKMENKITAEDECFKIIQAIWSCKSDEQKDGCVNMFETYKKKHGEENIGITLIKLELKRLDQIIKLSKLRHEQMKKMQDELAKQQKENEQLPSDEKLKAEFNKGNIVPIDTNKVTKTSKEKK
tara:strand:- start:124 stop:510 length:387 start_codon:yes stop_codon:yes gene_type:complete